jgi:hypothetical protein
MSLSSFKQLALAASVPFAIWLGACSSTPTAPPVGADGGTGDGGSCPSGKTSCDAECVDAKTDVKNCGVCGKTCGVDQACTDGACKLYCPAGLSNCADRCVPLPTDRANCGACGKSCGAGEVCSDGLCKLSCAAQYTTCGGAAPFCAATDSDRANCGTCGNACAAGEICSKGACLPFCGPGTSRCGARCVDLQVDSTNCGACAAADPRATCAPGFFCTGAVCCTGLKKGCGGACTDVGDDPRNCGACGKVCPAATPFCGAGVCSNYHAPSQMMTDFSSGGQGCGDSSKWYTKDFGMMTFDACEAAANLNGAQYMGSNNGGSIDGYAAPYANDERWVGEASATNGYVSADSWANAQSVPKATMSKCVLAYANAATHGILSYNTKKVSLNGKTYAYVDLGALSEKDCYNNARDHGARPLNPEMLALPGIPAHFVESHTCHGSMQYVPGGFQADGSGDHGGYRCVVGYTDQ